MFILGILSGIFLFLAEKYLLYLHQHHPWMLSAPDVRPTAWSPLSTEPVFWFYVKEVLSKHELQRFYALRHIASDVGRGRAWLRCALNENSLERYLHMLLAERGRLRYPAGRGSGCVRAGGGHRRICPPASGMAGFPSFSSSLSGWAVGTVHWRPSEDACRAPSTWQLHAAGTQ